MTNGETYNIALKAVNSVGNGPPSNIESVTPSSVILPPAPVITGISFKSLDTMVLTFTQVTNSATITNYKYSLNGGITYTALSPVDTTSPITIGGLSSNTTYNIKIRGVSAAGDGYESNLWTEATYANVNYVYFTEPGTSSWTAPTDVNYVQYLIVGGGGGGGSTYSKINVLGNVLVTDTPQPGAYWINSANLTNNRYSGRMYYGYNSAQNSTSFTDPIRLTASQNFTPNNVVYAYNKWYNTEIVYLLNGSLPLTSNYLSAESINSTICNNSSGGSGGGAGGQFKMLTSTSKHDVIPGQSYTVVVGGGGAGGVGGTNTEALGTAGGDSSFDTVISVGGSGGGASRTTAQNTDTNKNGKGGNGGVGNGYLVGGSGGGQNFSNNYGLYNSGGPGYSGFYVNFDGNGSKFYSSGGNGGVPNTVATGTTAENVGKGGSGTGATLNSYADGIAGGSGIVIIRYFT